MNLELHVTAETGAVQVLAQISTPRFSIVRGAGAVPAGKDGVGYFIAAALSNFSKAQLAQREDNEVAARRFARAGIGSVLAACEMLAGRIECSDPATQSDSNLVEAGVSKLVEIMNQCKILSKTAREAIAGELPTLGILAVPSTWLLLQLLAEAERLAGRGD